MSLRQILRGGSAKSFLTSWGKNAELPDMLNKTNYLLTRFNTQQFVWSNTCRAVPYTGVAMKFSLLIAEGLPVRTLKQQMEYGTSL